MSLKNKSQITSASNERRWKLFSSFFGFAAFGSWFSDFFGVFGDVFNFIRVNFVAFGLHSGSFRGLQIGRRVSGRLETFIGGRSVFIFRVDSGRIGGVDERLDDVIAEDADGTGSLDQLQSDLPAGNQRCTKIQPTKFADACGRELMKKYY